jgi:hypothetical protein
MEWDPAKRNTNMQKHGLDFADVSALDWAQAIVLEDGRKDYGEPRFIAFVS